MLSTGMDHSHQKPDSAVGSPVLTSVPYVICPIMEDNYDGDTRLYRGKNHGEEWYLRGWKDAFGGIPMQAEQNVKGNPGSLPRSLVWNAYQAGYEAGQLMETNDRYYTER